ncbi:MAG: hypothetical protein GQF41_0774 [Candidatus Rifleibacterium amylolyticum]|nr:MAG: hypothetical protein GQF41_0774 [Candidatus Rifleibacterium amylolyticum]
MYRPLGIAQRPFCIRVMSQQIFFAVKAKKWYSGDGKPADIGG